LEQQETTMLGESRETMIVPPYIGESRIAMGQKAAEDIAAELRSRLASQSGVRMIFAAAPSQSEMLASLVAASGIDWTRVTAFHMDEYLGLPTEDPRRFALWLRRNLFDHLPFAAVHLIEPGDVPELTAADYAAKLGAAPIDVVCCGIGANGHLAFNDPPADFEDPKDVKIVQLDAACRQQQVEDGCFSTIDKVPTQAITLTIPRLLAATRLFCCVPGSFKKDAVRCALEGPIDPACPASALRMHGNWSLYLDHDSAAALSQD
jgi:glucosamine-6-phosphate deaminase